VTSAATPSSPPRVRVTAGEAAREVVKHLARDRADIDALPQAQRSRPPRRAWIAFVFVALSLC
jgi:hypothetical protein